MMNLDDMVYDPNVVVVGSYDQATGAEQIRRIADAALFYGVTANDRRQRCGCPTCRKRQQDVKEEHPTNPDPTAQPYSKGYHHTSEGDDGMAELC